MQNNTIKGILLAMVVLVAAAFFMGCSLLDKYGLGIPGMQGASDTEAVNIGTDDFENIERIVSESPDGKTKIYLSSDNNLVIKDNNTNKIIYRNYEKDSELLRHPYSLWSTDFFRIQWSDDSSYAYIIDSIYDFKNDKLIPLKDCLIFSWVGNRGVYLSDGKLVEGKFWDHGFYGLYASQKLKIFEAGNTRIAKELNDGRYFIVSEDTWDEDERTLFRCLGPTIKVKTARFKYDDEHMYDKLIKAYQELREDEKAWKLLNGSYTGAAVREKALQDFRKIQALYPVKLLEEQFSEDHLNWDFDMGFYIVDIIEERIS